jgi:hypothetical protein
LPCEADNSDDDLASGMEKLLQQEHYLTLAGALALRLGDKNQKIFCTIAKIVLEIILEIDNIM